MIKELVYMKKDGYWFGNILHYKGSSLIKNAIIIDETITEQIIDYIVSNNIDKVIIDLSNNEIKSLSFLEKIKHIQYLKIYGDGKIDNTPLYDLNQLKFLEYLNPSDLEINKLLELEFFTTNRMKRLKGFQNAMKLKTLKLYDYNNESKIENLKFLNDLKSLEVLSISGFNIVDLDDINNFINLKVLIIKNMSKLSRINGLITLKDTLTSLSIYNCKKISDYETLNHLRKLKFLAIEKVGQLQNINFISSLDELKTFISINNTIIDGDLTESKKCDDAVILPFKKYYHIYENGEKKHLNIQNISSSERDYGDKDIPLWRRVSL